MSTYLAKSFCFLAALAGLKSKLTFADEGKGASGADDAGGAGGGNDQGSDDAGGDGKGKSVSYDTYKKLLSESKKAKADAKALSDRLAAIENDKLLAEGKKDEAYSKLKGDFDKLSKTHKETLNGFVMSSLNGQVREVAAELGASKLDAVVKLIEGDLSEIEVDSKTFRADKSAIVELINGLKKQVPELFNKTAPKINSKMPSGTDQKRFAGGTKNLKELSKAEIFDELKKLSGR